MEVDRLEVTKDLVSIPEVQATTPSISWVSNQTNRCNWQNLDFSSERKIDFLEDSRIKSDSLSAEDDPWTETSQRIGHIMKIVKSIAV